MEDPQASLASLYLLYSQRKKDECINNQIRPPERLNRCIGLQPNYSYILGRAPDVGEGLQMEPAKSSTVPVKLHDSSRSLSRKHTLIEFDEKSQKFVLQVLSSAGHVKVNKDTLRKPEKISLKNGDIIRFGSKLPLHYIMIYHGRHERCEEEENSMKQANSILQNKKRKLNSEHSTKAVHQIQEMLSDGSKVNVQNMMERLEVAVHKLEKATKDLLSKPISGAVHIEEPKQLSSLLKSATSKYKKEEKNSISANTTNVLNDLMVELNCLLCGYRMEIPTLLPCSHGFCKLCICKYLHGRTSSGKSLACPTCKRKCTPTQQTKQRILFFSDQLESIIELCSKYVDKSPREKKRVRDQKYFEEKFVYEDASSEESGNDDMVEKKDEPAKPRCDYCGENDHEDANCPHRNSEDNDESEDD